MSGSPTFSVRLRGREDRARFWFWDPSHFPGPVTPAAATFDLPAMAAGFSAAAEDLRRPLAGQHIRVERGFVYFGIDLPETPGALATRETAYQETVTPRVETALVDWTDRYAPEAARLSDALHDLAGLVCGDAAFADVLEEAVALRAVQWRIHDLALVPAMEAAARLTTRYAGRLGGPLAVQTLLQGFPNRQTEAAEALETLAESVRHRPRLTATVLSSDGGVESAPDAADGAWFDAELRRFLASYGRRAEGWDVGTPTWAEDRSPVLTLLRERLRRPPAQPGSRRRHAAAERDAAVERALRGLPDDQRPPFLAALRAAQAYAVVSEDHNALIDQQGMAALRAVLLAAGARLTTDGRLARPEEVVWLTRAEVVDVLRLGRAVRHLPAFRRGWQRRRSRLTPPRTFGRTLPPWAADNPTLADFFGLGAEPPAVAGRLQGRGVSPGVAEGRARVVRSLEELESLEPGEILVCPTTSPAWTPWLDLIGGAVVETGGMLSHTAVLAREYGIPCVVNLRQATAIIPTGASLRLDGTTGTVTWSTSMP